MNVLPLILAAGVGAVVFDYFRMKRASDASFHARPSPLSHQPRVERYAYGAYTPQPW